jgi:cell wall assembly regulator SMI1
VLFLLDTVGEKQLANQWLFTQEGAYIYTSGATCATVFKNITLKKYWEKIETWILANCPPILDTLNAGASEQDINNLENVISLKLPLDFIEFYKIHNGQSFTHLNLFDGDRLLSVDEIISEWKLWNEVLPDIDKNCKEMYGEAARSTPDKGIKPYWWSSSWIPITSNGCGDNYCIDLDPTSEGTCGQIIRMWHDMPNRDLLATSLKNWIDNYVTDLQSGVYTISDDVGWGGIVKKD